MATIALSPDRNYNSITSNKRIPLANNQNAVNSPCRPFTAATTIKRSRNDAEKSEDLISDQQPPFKKQAVDTVETRPRTPVRRQALQPPDRVTNKKAANPQPTTPDRRLYAAKDKQVQQRVERQEKAAAESLNGIKQWQKHYRKVFPEFVFYFESVPADVRVKCSKQIRALGAVSAH